jgi:decaprenylphospho-beta-D-ribofuranose 2-oxidase
VKTLTSWGQYPKIKAHVEMPSNTSALRNIIKLSTEIIPRGNGRSYGDSSLGFHVVSSLARDHVLNLNREKQTIKVHSGVSIEQLLHYLIPRGYFLPVVPGTKHITIGGAVASDIHGKNHHKAGTFTEHVQKISLILSNGEQVTCSREVNSDLFYATCGGMGLTGYIDEVEFSLKLISSNQIDQITHKSKNLDELLDLFDLYQNKEYSVAWIDCLARGSAQGRGVFFAGEHKCGSDAMIFKSKPYVFSVPTMPNWFLNSILVRLFNFFYYHKNFRKISTQTVGIDSFFFPLDGIKHWNNLYGKNGFTQFQMVVPKDKGREAIKQILSKVSEKKNVSFLAVLKLFGPKNDNYLSFPIEGYTLTLDFKISPHLFFFLEELNEIVMTFKGRVYLAKDASLSKQEFHAMYEKNIQQFQDVRVKFNAMKFSSVQSRRLGL